jgi:hypothetical protein
MCARERVYIRYRLVEGTSGFPALNTLIARVVRSSTHVWLSNSKVKFTQHKMDDKIDKEALELLAQTWIHPPTSYSKSSKRKRITDFKIFDFPTCLVLLDQNDAGPGFDCSFCLARGGEARYFNRSSVGSHLKYSI